MKNKIFLFVICLFCFFGFKLNAKADNTTIIFDFDNTNVQNVVNNNQSLIDDIQSYINLNNTRNFYYNISIRNTRYLIVGFGGFTADYIWYMPSLSGTTFYQGATQGLNFNDNQNVKPPNFSCIGNCYTKYFELDLNNLSDSSISTFKSSILSFLNSPTGYNGVSPQVVTYNVIYNYFLNTNNFFVYYSSLPLYFKKYSTNSTAFDIKIGDTIFHQDSFFPSYSDIRNSVVLPEISTNVLYNTNSSNQNISATITVDWTVKDVNSYVYKYKNINSSDWSYISSEQQIDTINISKNGTFIFEVDDLNSNVIDTSSITVSSINEEAPYIIFEDLTNNQCLTNYNNVSYQTCSIVKLYANNFNEFKYKLYYSLDNGENWTEKSINTSLDSYIYVYENSTILAKIIDLDNNNIIDTSSYTISNISLPNGGVPYITFDINCSHSYSYNSLHVILHNFDVNEYRLRYKSINDYQFSNLSLINENNVLYSFIPIYDATNYLFEIFDENDNVISTASFNHEQSFCNISNDDELEEYDFENLISDLSYGFQNDSTAMFFARLLRIIYDSAPEMLVKIFIRFFVLSMFSVFVYVVGWR